MFNKTIFVAFTILAVSAGVATAQTTYNIAITGACDTLSLTLETDGVVVGQSTTSGCDNSNMIGYKAKLKKSEGPGGKVLIAAGDFGLEPDAWDWAFNLKTLTATLTGTTDGTTILQDNFSFTFTTGVEKIELKNNGSPSASSLALSQGR